MKLLLRLTSTGTKAATPVETNNDSSFAYQKVLLHHADISASALDKSKHSFTRLTSVENIQTVLTSLLSQCYISESNSWKLSKGAKQQGEKFVFQLILFAYMMFKSKILFYVFSLPALSPMNTFNVKLLNRFPPKTQSRSDS